MKKHLLFFSILMSGLLWSCGSTPGLMDMEVRRYRKVEIKPKNDKALEPIISALNTGVSEAYEDSRFSEKQFSTPEGFIEALIVLGDYYKRLYDKEKDLKIKKECYDRALLNYSRALEVGKKSSFQYAFLLGQGEDVKRVKYYYFSEEGAQKLDADMKSGKYTEKGLYSKKFPKLLASAKASVKNIVVSASSWGSELYESKKFLEASEVFYGVYEGQKTIEWPDTSFLYNAALSSLSAVNSFKGKNTSQMKEVAKVAISYYEAIKKLGYTGIKTSYYAVEKKTGEKTNFAEKKDRDFRVKIGTHDQPSVVVSSSIRPSYIKNLIYLYKDVLEDMDAAIVLLDEEYDRDPRDIDVLFQQAAIYHKQGRIEELIAKWKSIISGGSIEDSMKPTIYFNLGVVYSRELADNVKAKEYYKKAIEADPNYSDAYVNISMLILSEEKDINSKLSDLGMSRSDKRKAKKLDARKKTMYKEVIPYIEKARSLTKDENEGVLKTLKNIYYKLDMKDQTKEVNEVLKAKSKK